MADNINTYVINNDSKGIRIDKYLADSNEKFSRSYTKKLIKNNKVLVNGKVTKASYKLQKNDLIKVKLPEPEKLDLEPMEMELEILYEDESIMVINKPPGLIVHPVPGNYKTTLVNALLAYSKGLSTINGVKRPGIVHRLDKDTSGALIVAKNNTSHKKLIKQFKERKINKIYRTIVKGNIKHEKGTIDAPIGRDQNNRKKMAVTRHNSKKAVTHFEVLNRNNNKSYLLVKLETGRTHQIRVHLSYMGFPILGDDKYGKRKSKHNIKRQMLHAYKLGFYHPEKDDWMEITAPLPDDFRVVLKKYSLI